MLITRKQNITLWMETAVRAAFIAVTNRFKPKQLSNPTLPNCSVSLCVCSFSVSLQYTSFDEFRCHRCRPVYPDSVFITFSVPLVQFRFIFGFNQKYKIDISLRCPENSSQLCCVNCNKIMNNERHKKNIYEKMILCDV